MTAPKPRRTNNQPRHKGKKPARPHSSEATPTQDEEDKQNQKNRPQQNSKEAEAPKIKKHEQKTERIPKNVGTRDKLERKTALHQTPKQRYTNK